MNRKVSYAVICLLLAIYGCHAQTHPKDSLSSVHAHLKTLADSARHHAKKGNRNAAMHYHQQIIHKSRKHNLPEYEIRSLIDLAHLLKQEDTGRNIEYLYRALNLAQQIRHQQLTADIYRALAETYKERQNYGLAIFALEQHQKLLDSLFTISKTREIARVKAEEARKLEQTVSILCIVAISVIALVFAWFFYRTKRLNKKLQELNTVKDKLFSIIGHDLRAPAGNVIQALAIIQSGNLPPPRQQDLLALTKTQGEAFLETLDSLLKWGKSQLQGTEVHATNFNPQDIIHKNTDMLTGLADRKQIKIVQQLPARLSVYADPDHFDFIIRNLLSNAIKFSHNGGTVTIAAEIKKEDVIFSVRDEGVGIAVEKQKEFNTGNMHVAYGTNGEKGTGLGLLLTKEFVKANKGRIWFESQEGKGTTFYFSITNIR